MTSPPGTTGAAIPFSKGTFMAIAAFTAVAWYNVAELNVQVFLTFKRHRGLYFWSLIISSYGCVLHALGFLLKFFELTSNTYLSVTIITIGWYCMVTGQAVVLYSRLHLVVREQKILRGILAMIIIDAICFHIPTTVLTYGSNASPNKQDNFTAAFAIVERLQMTAFCIQEFIISGVYVWSTIRLLRPVYHGRTRKVMMQLIWINLIIIGMDVCLLAMEYSNIYDIEATLKAMVYSIKLKLEFAVLNQLMTLANSSVNSHQMLQIEEGHSEKSTRPAGPGRSKSTEYISCKYEKPSRSSTWREAAATTSRLPDHSRNSSFGKNGAPSKNNFQWVPDLDRSLVVETQHIEHASPSREPELSELTNPAAHFKPSRPRAQEPVSIFSSYNGTFGIKEDDVDPLDTMPGRVISPTLTGTTIDQSPRHGRPSVPNEGLSGRGTPENGRRRAAPPPSLNLEGVMPNGLLKSTRPSVSEWGRESEGEVSPTSDGAPLNPYENSTAISPASPGSVRMGRQRARQSMGMDFMTSALHEHEQR